MKKTKSLVEKFLYVSRLTGIQNKKIRIISSVVLSNLTVLLDILIIIIFGILITNSFDGSSDISKDVINFILSNKFLIPIIVVLRFVFILLDDLNIQLLTQQVNEKLKSKLFLQVFDNGNYSIADAYFYVNQVTGHVSSFYRAITKFFNSLIQLFVYGSFLIYTDIETVGYFILAAMVLFFPTKKLLVIGRAYMHESFLVNKGLSEYLNRILDNLFLIKILKTNKIEFNNFNDLLKNSKNATVKNHAVGAFNSVLPSFFTLFVLSIFFASSNNNQLFSIEFIGVLLRLFQTLGGFNNNLNLVVNSSVHVEELYKFNKEKIIKRADYYQINTKQKIAASLEKISFKYINSEDYLFENLTLDIPKNKHTIITGPNGSGKSTLLGIISGILYPENGTIKLSSNSIGYVGVTPLIISGTLKDNLLYGSNREYMNEELTDLVNEFSLFGEKTITNLDIQVSNKTLSSGQMQKISFMRTLLASADIILLDESTSNLDEKTKNQIFNILNQKSITIINSTHNPLDFNFDHHLSIGYDGEKRTFKVN